MNFNAFILISARHCIWQQGRIHDPWRGGGFWKRQIRKNFKTASKKKPLRGVNRRDSDTSSPGDQQGAPLKPPALVSKTTTIWLTPLRVSCCVQHAGGPTHLSSPVGYQLVTPVWIHSPLPPTSVWSPQHTQNWLPIVNRQTSKKDFFVSGK